MLRKPEGGVVVGGLVSRWFPASFRHSRYQRGRGVILTVGEGSNLNLGELVPFRVVSLSSGSGLL